MSHIDDAQAGADELVIRVDGRHALYSDEVIDKVGRFAAVHVVRLRSGLR
jgi:hypothetical protein